MMEIQLRFARPHGKLSLTKIMADTQKNEPRTKFQRWIQPALTMRGWDAAELARRIGRDYNYVWRIVHGDPEKYPNAKRPGVKLAAQIGEALGDIEGALAAAEHEVPALRPRQIGGSRSNSLAEVRRYLDDAELEAITLFRGMNGDNLTLRKKKILQILKTAIELTGDEPEEELSAA